MADGDTSKGTFFNARQQREILDPFVDRFDDNYSGAVRDAMKMYLYIDEALEDQELAFANERDKRIWVRGAINKELRRQGESIEQIRR